MAQVNKNYSFMEFPLSIKRQGNFPLDASSVFYSYEDAQEYAVNNPTAVVGQPVTVVDESAQTVSLYLVGFNGLIGFDGGSGGISSPDVDTIRVMDRTDYEVLPESDRNNTRILYFLRG